jgi:hypothetical protein
MRRLRIIFVLAVVAVALMSSPKAFADKGGKDSPLMSAGESKGAGMADTWEIRCEGCSGSTTAICEGDVGGCLAFCEMICGAPCGICQSFSNYC